MPYFVLQLLGNMQQILETCHLKNILHVEIDCDSLVVVGNGEGAFDIRALVSPVMQLVPDKDCKGYVPHTVSCESCAPPAVSATPAQARPWLSCCISQVTIVCESISPLEQSLLPH